MASFDRELLTLVMKAGGNRRCVEVQKTHNMTMALSVLAEFGYIKSWKLAPDGKISVDRKFNNGVPVLVGEQCTFGFSCGLRKECLALLVHENFDARVLVSVSGFGVLDGKKAVSLGRGGVLRAIFRINDK